MFVRVPVDTRRRKRFFMLVNPFKTAQTKTLPKQFTNHVDLQKSIEEANRLKDQIQSLQLKNSELQLIESNLKKDISLLNERLTTLDKLKTETRSTAILDTKLAELSGNLQDMTKDYNNLRELYQSCTNNSNVCNREKADLKVALSNLQNDIESASKQYIRTLQEKEYLIKDLQSQIRNAQTSTAVCDENLIQTTQLTNSLQDENNTLKLQLKSLMKEQENLTKVQVQTTNVQLQICEQNRNRIAIMLPYINRQLEVYLATFTKAKKVSGELRDEWEDFVDRYETVYLDGEQTIARFSQLTQTCTELENYYQSIVTLHENMLIAEQELLNLYEDITGALRIYVRIKPQTGGSSEPTVVKSGKSVIFQGSQCGLGGIQTFSNFFGVMDSTFSNADVYTGCTDTKIDTNLQVTGQTCCRMNDAAGVCRVTFQIKDGYNVILFGYGYSGSGKTTTLLGSDGIPGIAQLTIANIQAKVSVSQVFELHHHKIDFRNKSFNSGEVVRLIKGKTHNSIFKAFAPELVKDESEHLGPYLQREVNRTSGFDDISGTDLSNIRNAVDALRIERNRIKATPNNPQSSRSHLFIILDFHMNSGKVGHLTIVDMGGREQPEDLLQFFVNKPEEKPWQTTSILIDKSLVPNYFSPRTFSVNSTELQWFVDHKRYNTDTAYKRNVDTYITRLNRISADTSSVLDVLKESIYVNETINQLIYFFGERFKTPIVKSIKFPLDERKNPYRNDSLLTGIPDLNEKMGMYKILHLLSGLSKKTKFVMICNVRSESIPVQLCTSTLSTLQFASFMTKS